MQKTRSVKINIRRVVAVIKACLARSGAYARYSLPSTDVATAARFFATFIPDFVDLWNIALLIVRRQPNQWRPPPQDPPLWWSGIHGEPIRRQIGEHEGEKVELADSKEEDRAVMPACYLEQVVRNLQHDVAH
jgi:hypothetical protein